MVQEMRRLKIGSLFAGIGGFELGIERAIKGAETIWQVEQNKYCQSILQKHWPNAQIYDDVRNITKHNVEPVDILIGGFPCQSISVAGKQEGLENEKKSGLWWEFHRIISELRPRIVVMENVPNVLRLGGLDILGSLTKIGYDCEWTIISAKQFGAPHVRKRWFCVAYPNGGADGKSRENRPSDTTREGGETTIHQKNCQRNKSTRTENIWNQRSDNTSNIITNSNGKRSKEQSKNTITMGQERQLECGSSKSYRSYEGNYWKRFAPEPPLCTVDDGISFRVARLKALGNAIVPQCSQYIGECIVRSGLLDDI